MSYQDYTVQRPQYYKIANVQPILRSPRQRLSSYIKNENYVHIVNTWEKMCL